MKIIFTSVMLSFLITFSFVSADAYEIPGWIKNNADWWAQDQINDKTFASGIEFLVKEGIIQIPETTQISNQNSEGIPGWIKNNADWWAQGLISDDDFIKGIQYLVENGIIIVSDNKMVKEQSSEQLKPSDWLIQELAGDPRTSFEYPPDWKINYNQVSPTGPSNEFIGFVKTDGWYFLPDEKEQKLGLFKNPGENFEVVETTTNGHPTFIIKGKSVFAQLPVETIGKSFIIDKGGNYQVVQIISKFDSSKYGEYERIVEQIIDSFKIQG